MHSTNGPRHRLGGSQRRTIAVFMILLALSTLGFGWVVYGPARSSSATASNNNTQATADQGALIFKDVAEAQPKQTFIDLAQVDLFKTLHKQTDTKRTHILTSYDRNLYTQIFDAQKSGEWSRANSLMKRVHDRVLIGHVLYDRYIRAEDYKASYHELRSWMVKYGDHPDAYKVYQLAQKRRANNPEKLPAPQMAKKLLGTLELSWFQKETAPQPKGHMPRNRNAADVRQLMKQVQEYLKDEKVTVAYNLLGRSPASRMLTDIEYDSLLGEIASGYYYAGKNDAALHVAHQAIKRSGKFVPIAQWVAGLASWKNENYDDAAKYFAAISESQSRNPWMLSAGAFWAARAYEQLGRENVQNDWLHEAASYPRTFYGAIAQSILGNDVSLSWEEPTLTAPLVNALTATPSGKRGLALLDIKQNELAQKELRQVHPNGNHRVEKALIAVAARYKLASLSINLGNAVNTPDGKLYDVALYPVVPWKGDTETGIDPALVNALIRQESKFDPNAKNGRSGAKGLMQLMPETANFMSRDGIDASKLHDPQTNIILGQRYVRYLLDKSNIDGNLLYMAAAYNAGPANLARWQKDISYNDDPFLFIESIPMSETRAFVERVMTNYWIYAQRLKQETETLSALASGEWPAYDTQEGDIKLVSY